MLIKAYDLIYKTHLLSFSSLYIIVLFSKHYLICNKTFISLNKMLIDIIRTITASKTQLLLDYLTVY